MGDVRLLDPKTGAVTVLPADQAEAEFRSGRGQLPKGVPVKLVGESGDVIDAEPEKVSEAIRDGVFRFATKKDVNRHIAEGQPIQAFAEAALNNVALPGMYDLPAAALGADMDMVQARRETGAGTAGEIFGTGASLFVPGLGEANAAAQGTTRLAMKAMPHVLAEAGARALTEAAEKTLDGVIKNEVARAAIASGLGHAATGAGVGALATLDEAALGNVEASTETMVSGAIGGSLIGGTLGSALGGIGRKLSGKVDGRTVGGAGVARAAEGDGVGQLTANEITAALEATGQEVDAAGMKKWFPNLMAKVANRVTGVAEDDVQRVMSPAGRKAVLAGEQARDAVTKHTADLIDQLDANSTRFNLDEARLAPAVLDGIPAGIGDQAITHATDSLTAVRDHLRDMVKNAPNYGKTAEQMESALAPIRDRLAAAENRILSHIDGSKNIIAKADELEEEAVASAVAAGKSAVKSSNARGLRKLGAGFARNVYEDGDAAVKIAKNEEGVLQNLAEVELAGRSPVLNEIIDHSPDYSTVRQRKVQAFDVGIYGEPSARKLTGPLKTADSLPRAIAADGSTLADRVLLDDFLTKTKLDRERVNKLITAGKLELEDLADGRTVIKLPSKVEYNPDAAMAAHFGIPNSDDWLRAAVKGEYAGPRTPSFINFEERLAALKADVPELDVSDFGKASQWGINAEGEVVLIDFGDRLKHDTRALAKPRATRPVSLPGAWSDDKIREVLATKIASKMGANQPVANAVLGRLNAIAESAVPVTDKVSKEIYRELDQVYRTLSAQSKKIKPLIAEAPGLGDAAKVVQKSLQDADVWGGAARAHSELTTAAEREARARETLAAHFPLKGGKVDRNAVHSFTKDLDRVKGEPRVQALADWVDAQNALGETARRHSDLKFSTGAQRLIREYDQVHRLLREDAMTLNAQDRLLKANRAQGIIPGLALGSLVASAGMGPAGFLAGNAIGNAILNPGRSARQLAAILAFKQSVADHVAARVERIFTGKGAVRQLPIQAPRLVTAMIDGTPKERQDAYEEHLKEITAVSEPAAYVNHITPQLTPIAAAMPEHANQIAMHGQKTLAYLANELPKPVSTRGPQADYDFTNPPKPGKGDYDFMGPKKATAKPSPEDIRRYGKVVNVAMHGAPAILEAIEKGNLNAAQVRAFKSLFPHQDAELQRLIMDKLGTGRPSPKVARALRIYLTAGATDTTATSFQQSIYAENIVDETGTAPGGLPTANPRAPTMTGPLSTPTDLTATFPFRL